jgi:AraC-like DNA-binding protein
MGEKQEFILLPRLWIADPLPHYSNVWLFKANLAKGKGKFSSYQRTPSGVTIRIICKGKWIVKMNGHAKKIARGGIFCSLPSETIEFSQVEDEEWEWREIQFTGPSAEKFAGEFGLGKNSPATRPENPEKAIKLFKTIYKYIESEGRTAARMFALIYELISICGKSSGKLENEKVDKYENLYAMAIDYMKSNLELNVNIAEIAERLNVERTTLYRAFKNKTGKSPHKHMDWLRMIKSEELLEYTNMSISTIAVKLGFSDAKYFISWFKSRKGLSPGLWRKQTQEK